MIRNLLIAITLLSAMHLLADTKGLIEGKINKVLIVNSSNMVDYPVDVDFNPQVPGQLWVLNHGLESGGTTITIDNPGTTAQLNDYRKDGAAGHFLVYGSALAFGDSTWATAQDYFNANRGFFGGWCGPSLWPSDMSIYAIHGNPPTNQDNGSHYDMIHQSPYSSGIAHEEDNTYWVNDGDTKSISRYKFNEAHRPGGHDHADGQVYRYVDVPYEMNAGIPAHMVLEGNWLYYINPGTKSVNRFDITTGTKGQSLASTSNGGEQLAEFVEMNGGTWEKFVSEGLNSPSGIDIQGNYMIVSDNATGSIMLYDITDDQPILKKILHTGAESIMGIKFDAAGDIYYVDHLANKVFKLEGQEGINYYSKSNVHNSNSSEGNGFLVMIENNTESQITLTNINVNFNTIASSKQDGLMANYHTSDYLPVIIEANQKFEFPIEYDITSGFGVYDINTTLTINSNSEAMVTEINVIGITNDIPLVSVYDDTPQNLNTADLTVLLNATNYRDYMEMNTIDFQKYAHSARGLRTVIWNAGSFGTTNAQEYFTFQKLRDNGASIFYLGDGPMFLAGNISPEAHFNLNVFGAEYVSPILQGFSDGAYIMDGISGDDVTSEYQGISNRLTLYTTSNGTSAWPTSYLKPMANSFSIFNHSVSKDSVIAVRNETKNSRSVVQSFNMSNVIDINVRTQIFKSVMDWLTYKNATGVFELAGYEPVGVYPNPTTDYVQFDNLEVTPRTNITLLDLAGNSIRNIDNTQTSINVSDLSTGTYFLMIESENNIKFAKFVKQ